MKNFIALTFALILSLGVLFQTHANPDGKPIALAGTIWSGKDSEGDLYVYTFENDGTLAYESPSGSFRNGKWKQSGSAVYMQMNNRFSEYLGELNGESIEGTAWNEKGRNWTWKVLKQK